MAQGKSKDETDTKAADAAVVEAADPKGDVTVEFGGHEYTFRRKRASAMQFRLPMQKGQDGAAVEWLIGPAQFALFLDRSADDDGCTDESVYIDFVTAIGAELSAGN